MTTAPEWQELVDKEQVKLLHQVTPTVSIVSLVVALISANLFRGSIPDDVMANWLLLSFAAFIIRIGLWVFYQRKPNWFSKSIHWGRIFALGVFINGITWGYAVILFGTQNNFENQLLISLIIVSLIIGVAVYSSSSYLPTIYVFLIPTLGSIIISFSLLGSVRDISLVILSIMLLISIISFSRKGHLKFTENLILRHQLDVQKKEAERANIAKSKYLAAASHDLRQPLHAITLFTSLLEEKISSTELKNIVAQLQNSVVGLHDLLNTLLDISKLDAGIVKINRNHFCLQPIFNRLQNEFQTIAKEKSLKLTIDEINFYSHTDPALLESILRNLLSNALCYTDTGNVELRCFLDKESICIKVIDSGKGIPLESLDEVFEEFVQLHNPERDRSNGLGLGLSIVHRLSTLLGYTIDLASELNHGTEFTLWIPVGDRTLSVNSKHTPVNVTLKNLNDMYVVIIDDEKTIRDGMKQLLNNWHCRVDTFGCQAEAINSLRQSEIPPDAIFADYRLSENRTGVQAIKAIESLFDKPIPAVIITGDTAPGRLSEAHDSGYKLLHKPVQPGKLKSYLHYVNR